MTLDEAVALLAGTSLIVPASRLGEAHKVVLDDLGRLRSIKQRAQLCAEWREPEPQRKVADYILGEES